MLTFVGACVQKKISVETQVSVVACPTSVVSRLFFGCRYIRIIMNPFLHDPAAGKDIGC